MLTITYIRTESDLRYKYTGSVQQLSSAELVQKPGRDTNLIRAIKMGNIVPRAGIKPTSLALWANVLTIHHLSSLPSPHYPGLPVYNLPERGVQTATIS